jgi:tetratricopeptide (TPR) repeat protein
MNDADFAKVKEDAAATAKDQRAYSEYAFFQLLPRVADPAKRVQALDSFMQAYPDTPNAGQANFQYFVAYKEANNPAKADEYGEKSIAADPNNVATLNLVADDYSSRQTNLDKASEYAKKVLELAPAMKKPEGMSDADFKANQNSQLGLAHITLGYVLFQKEAAAHKVAPAIAEFKAAIDLLAANPALQGRALFNMGYAYEVLAPANHKAADEALSRSAEIASPWQAQAKDLLSKVRKAEHK